MKGIIVFTKVSIIFFNIAISVFTSAQQFMGKVYNFENYNDKTDSFYLFSNINSNNKLHLPGLYPMDSSVCYNWNTVSNSWMLSTKKLFTYDSSDNKIDDLTQTRNGSIWKNVAHHEYTYTNGNMTVDLYQGGWDGTIWTSNYYKHTFSYNGNGKIISEVDQSQDAFGHLFDDLQFIYTYDANGNQITKLYQYRDTLAMTWNNSTKDSSTYNVNSQMINKITQNYSGSNFVNADQHNYTYNTNGYLTIDVDQHWNGTTWVNFRKYTFTYDNNGNKLTYLNQVFIGGVFLNDTKDTYTFTGNLLTHSLHQVSDGTSLQNNQQYYYTYDVNGNLTIYTNQLWNGASWEDSFKSVYTYDSNNNQLSSLNFSSTNGSAYDKRIDSCLYYYKGSIVGISVNHVSELSISVIVYPNPIVSFATIEILNAKKINTYELVFYDILGNEIIKSEIRNQKTEINRINFSDGLYFYRIKSNSEIIGSGKIIISD